MKSSKFMLVVTASLMLSGGLFAKWGNGLGNEIKNTHIIESQQSGWNAWPHVDAPVASCPMAKGEKKCGMGKCTGCACCCACKNRFGRGLGGEYKSPFIPLGQQSGSNWGREIKKEMSAPVAKKETPKPVVAEAPKPTDSDGDGVIDNNDECPGTPSGTKVEASGCPATVKAIEDNWVLKGVNFETNSDKIKTESFGALDEAAAVLAARSRVRVQIQGHTDSMGNDKMNLDLSDRRAVSVKKYLVGKGVSAGQLETKGFGETVPVADNNSVAGRAQNRRIEFKVLSR